MGFIGAAVSVASSLFGGGSEKEAAGIQADAATAAGAAQLQATREVIKMQTEQYEQSRTDLAPWREIGHRALLDQGTMVKGPDYSLEDFEASPGYNFVKNEMTRALDASNAAKGSFYSGKPMRELARYSAGIASQEYGDWFNRERGAFNDHYNRLAGLSGTGQIATTDTSRLGANAANASSNATLTGAQNFGSTLLAAGASRASGVLGSAEAQRNTIKDVVSAGIDWWNA